MLQVLAAPQIATVHLRAGRARLDASLAVSSAGLLAIGGLVTAILLSVPPIIRAAGEARATVVRLAAERGGATLRR